MTAVSPTSAHRTESRSRAFLRLLARMCQHFPDLKEWLMDDFGRNERTRANFLELIEKRALNDEFMADGFADLAGELGGWIEEKKRLKETQPAEAGRPFGGLSWDEMEGLIRRYEARTLGLEAFSLARDWRKAGAAAKASPNLLQEMAELLDAAICSGNPRPILDLGHAVELLAAINPRRPSSAFGYADWWKLNALVYMLRHPRGAYRTREIRLHLASINLPISSLDFRRFCKRHGIRRDERAGRPRVHATG